MGLLFEAMKYHLLEPEEKRIFQSPRTRPRCSPKVFEQNSFSSYKILWHFNNNHRFFLLLVALMNMQFVKLSATILKLKGGFLWRKCPLVDPGIPIKGSLKFNISHYFLHLIF